MKYLIHIRQDGTFAYTSNPDVIENDSKRSKFLEKFSEDTSFVQHIVVDVDSLDNVMLEQAYCENGVVSIDSNWERNVMPWWFVRKEEIKKVESDLSSKTEEEQIALMSKINYYRSKSDESFWLNKAIENLDKRVSEGKPDKPVVRQKILDKLGA